LEAITKLVFEGLADRLRSPEAIRVYLEEYRAERQRLAEKEGRDRSKLARQLNSAESQLGRLVDAIAEGNTHWSTVASKIEALESDKLRLTRELEGIPAQVNVVELHPTAIQTYIGHIDDLAAGVANGKIGDEDRLLIRELIEKIIIYPTEKPGQLDIKILGKLTALLGDEGLPPTARLSGEFAGAGGGTRTPTTFVTGT
jgi:site-specific DNA recombinase